jgi:ribosomal protein L14
VTAATPRLLCSASVITMLSDSGSARQEIDGTGAIDVEAQISGIVREELVALSELDAETQDVELQTLISRMEQRAVSEVAGDATKGYQFGDVTKTVVAATRAEVQRQLDADWNTDDLSLLLRVAIFLGAGAAAPVAGLAALPAAALLATYGTVLKAELGVRATKEVAVRLAERAAQGVADSVRSYTGKEEYSVGDLTEATVRKVTGNEDYRFGDLTRGAVKKVTGKDEYRFGDLTRSVFRRMTTKRQREGGDAKPEEPPEEES